MGEITTVGLDLAKPVVPLCGKNAAGRVVVQRTLWSETRFWRAAPRGR